LGSLSIGYGVYIRTLRPPTSWEEYKNEWALITGASYGIGEGFARGLAKRGVNVILVARNEEKLEALQKDILTKYPKIKVKTIAVDLAKNGYLEKIMSEIKKLNVSVLINNVGGVSVKKQMPFYENAIDIIDYDINLNVITPMKITKAILPKIVERKKGRILSISSAMAITSPFSAVYGSNKRSIIAWTEAIEKEFILSGLDRVEAVVSVTGFVDTPALRELTKTKERHDLMAPAFVSTESYAEAELDLFGTNTVSTAHWKHLMLYYSTKALACVPASFLKMVGFDMLKIMGDDL